MQRPAEMALPAVHVTDDSRKPRPNDLSVPTPPHDELGTGDEDGYSSLAEDAKRSFRRVNLQQISNVHLDASGQVMVNIHWIRTKNDPVAPFRHMSKPVQLKILEQHQDLLANAERHGLMAAEVERLQKLVPELVRICERAKQKKALKRERSAPYNKHLRRPSSAASMRKSEKSTSGDEKMRDYPARPGSSQSVRLLPDRPDSRMADMEVREGVNNKSDEKMDNRQDSGYAAPQGFFPIQSFFDPRPTSPLTGKLDDHEFPSASESDDNDVTAREFNFGGWNDNEIKVKLVTAITEAVGQYSLIKKNATKSLQDMQSDRDHYKDQCNRQFIAYAELQKQFNELKQRQDQVERENAELKHMLFLRLKTNLGTSPYPSDSASGQQFNEMDSSEDYYEQLIGSAEMSPPRPLSAGGQISEGPYNTRRAQDPFVASIVSGNLDTKRGNTPAPLFSTHQVPPNQSAFIQPRQT